jgi:hypothetical protein
MQMKKAGLVGVLIVVLLVCWWGLQRQTTPDSSTMSNPVKNTTVSQVLKSPSDFKAITKVADDSGHRESQVNLTLACENLAQAVHALDLRSEGINPSVLMEQLKSIDESLWHDCKKQSDVFSKIIADIELHCTRNPENQQMPEDQQIKNEKVCGSDLFFLRALLTSAKTKGIAVKDLHDPKVVAELFFSEFYGKDAEHAPDFNRIEQLAERFKDLRPDLPGGLKILASVKVINGMFKAKENQAEASALLWQQSEQVMDDYERRTQTGQYSKSGEESGLEDSRIAVKTKGFQPAHLKSVADEVLATHPNDPHGLQLRSYDAWLKGDRKQALSDLKTAIKYSKDHEELKRLYEELQKPNAPITAFRPVFKVGVDGKEFGL